MENAIIGMKFKFKKEKLEVVVNGDVRKKVKKEIKILSDFFNNRNNIENNDTITIRNIEKDCVYFSVNFKRLYLKTDKDVLRKLYRTGNLILI